MAESKKCEQFLLEIMFAMDEKENKWLYGACYDKGMGTRYYPSLKEARAGLSRLLAKFNKDFEYGPDGKRKETFAIGGGFAADMKHDKRIDDMNRIVKWRIRRREVTPWEEVEVA